MNCPTQIIGLTSLFKIIHSTGAKGSTQINQKNKLGLKRKEQKETEGCPGLAHRTVRCATRQYPVHRGALARTLHLRISQTQLRYNSSDCPVCHWTVWCASGAMAICAQRSTLQSEQCNSECQSRSQRGTRLSGVTHRTIRCHMRTKPPTVDQLLALTRG